MAGLFKKPIAFKKEHKSTSLKRIAVIPALRGAGASFICGQMALKSKEKAGIVELGKPYFYVALGFEKRFMDKDFVFADDYVKNSFCDTVENTAFKINWLVRRPDSTEQFSFFEIRKLFDSIAEGEVFFDFSGVSAENISELLVLMDEIYLVADPLPSRLIEASAFIEKIRLMYPDCTIVINKMNKGVHRPELLRFLGKAKILEIPYFPPEKIYQAEYNCSLPDFT